ncbi:receptor for retinol uptake stra6 [Scyliorhinus canicula]|uniref:receptor for retinol uptake stra6 n=1 Tax=Scyliorhinus canicula TaxID=7830 RepID=UPI0018F5B5FF|nr:receptor for retinol uptake stra6 [Scyliorhinus canicula]XP_038640122.1 receptor for retinol uptake stra6 [Scyliorhinus canicula]XP_038640123.1 receptor for retinol uptake stra6 [Scyliorhinus canicula]XP_038640124.1 receptor for retinol uptake stra6 [Scyliorhinus canicula]
MDPRNYSLDIHEPDFLDYSDWYIDDRMEPTSTPEDVTSCNSSIPGDLYHLCAAGVSLLALVLLSFSVKRRRLCLGCCAGAPGLLHPVGFLEHDYHRGIAASVFGVLFCSLCAVVLDDDPLPFIRNPPKETKEYWKITALLYYPALYYPLLACAAVKSKLGYLLGSLLSWLHCSISLCQDVECPLTAKWYKYYSLLRSLPQLLSLAFLSLIYPLLLLRNGETSRNLPWHRCPANQYYTDYLKIILKKNSPRNSVSTDQLSLRSRIERLMRSYIYVPMKGFRIPTKLVISLTVAIVSIYQFALLLVVYAVPTLEKMRAGVQEQISYVLEGFGVNLSESRSEVLNIVKYYIWVVEVCYVSAVAVSCSFTLSMLMRSMVLHRENLQALRRGDTQKVFNLKRHIRPSHSAIVYWMSFTSYQAAFICLGLLIQQVVFFTCFLLFTFLIVVPLLQGHKLLVFRVLENMWPFWLTLILVVLIQYLLARFLFLQKGGKHLDITNRRSLYIFTYLLFTFNVLIGVIAGVWRVVFTALYNIVHFCRLDLSLINRGAEFLDPGYRCYSSFLEVEASQSNPVMKAFCFLILQSQCSGRSCSDNGKSVEEGIQLVSDHQNAKTTKSKRALARWFLMYTLLNNPSLVNCRRSATDVITNGELKGSSKLSTDSFVKSELCEKAQSDPV